MRLQQILLVNVYKYFWHADDELADRDLVQGDLVRESGEDTAHVLRILGKNDAHLAKTAFGIDDFCLLELLQETVKVSLMHDDLGIFLAADETEVLPAILAEAGDEVANGISLQCDAGHVALREDDGVLEYLRELIFLFGELLFCQIPTDGADDRVKARVKMVLLDEVEGERAAIE